MISVVGKVMASLAAIDHIKTAAIEYYNKTLTHRPAGLISIALRIDRNEVRCELMAFTWFFDPRWQESVVTENMRLPFFTVRRIGHGRGVAGTSSFLPAACADASPPTLWRHSR
jgi:hypothetical protein